MYCWCLCGSSRFITQIALVLQHDNGKGQTVYCVLGAGERETKQRTIQAADWFAHGHHVQPSGHITDFYGTHIFTGMVYPDLRYINRYIHDHPGRIVHLYPFFCILPYAL